MLSHKDCCEVFSFNQLQSDGTVLSSQVLGHVSIFSSFWSSSLKEEEEVTRAVQITDTVTCLEADWSDLLVQIRPSLTLGDHNPRRQPSCSIRRAIAGNLRTMAVVAQGVPLVGPPEARRQPPVVAPKALPPPGVESETVMSTGEEESTGDVFLDALKRDMMGVIPPVGLTENMSATFLSSGSSCLDFFFQVVPDTDAERVGELLAKAWEQDSLTALKLVFQLRGVRGTGKSDKQGFYAAALWLYENHPATLLANVPLVAPFGYYKDLLELVQRVLELPEETEKRLVEMKRHANVVKEGKARAPKKEGGVEIIGSTPGAKKAKGFRRSTNHATPGYWKRKGAAARAAKEAGTLKPQAERIALHNAQDQATKEEAAVLRKQRKADLARRALGKYNTDLKFHALHSAVAEVFANSLVKDMQLLKENKIYDLSLAAKWAPSLDLSYDKLTLLCEAIARRMFPKDPEYADVEEDHYSYRVRERYRKEVLGPLRQKLELPEVYISAKRWEDLPYTRVPSVAMRRYKEIFEKHDKERFAQFLEDVQAGKKKIAAGAVLPHQIMRDAMEQAGQQPNVGELQWQRMVQDLKESGKLSNSIAVCDVSGSMSGEPMEVCIALGMLVAELCEDPWKGYVITFSDDPQLHEVKGGTLADKYQCLQAMDWGMSTDFQKVFDQILATAVRVSLPPEKMIKRVFVFSDMEFNEASERKDWQGTDYVVICRKFRDAGYGAPPEVVFWNLRNSGSTPVMERQQGVALVSGFSKNLLKLFLQNDGAIDPNLVLQQAICGPLFNELRIVD